MNHMRKLQWAFQMGLPEDGDENQDEDGEETKLSPFNKLAELL